ncbi:unnamed protein product, partial [Penicillium egyptiacum]
LTGPYIFFTKITDPPNGGSATQMKGITQTTDFFLIPPFYFTP